MPDHDHVIEWKQFSRNWPFVRGIHRSPVNSPHKGQWRGALMFSLISAWINGWVNNGEAGDLRHHRAHYDVIVMIPKTTKAKPIGGNPRIWTNLHWNIRVVMMPTLSSVAAQDVVIITMPPPIMNSNTQCFLLAYMSVISCTLYIC